MLWMSALQTYIVKGVYEINEYVWESLMCVNVLYMSLCVFLQLLEHFLANQAGSGRATPAAVLSQQPASPAQLISLLFYPVTARCQCGYLSIRTCVCVCVNGRRYFAFLDTDKDSHIWQGGNGDSGSEGWGVERQCVIVMSGCLITGVLKPQ